MNARLRNNASTRAHLLRVATRGGFELGVETDPRSGRWFLTGDARVVATPAG